MKYYQKPTITELLAISSNFISDDPLISGTDSSKKDTVEEVTNKDVFDIRF